jgi:hypothetical protein
MICSTQTATGSTMTDITRMLNEAPSPLDVQFIEEEDHPIFSTGDYLGIYDRSGRLLLAVQECDLLNAQGERLDP